jgi:hypothetical protein
VRLGERDEVHQEELEDFVEVRGEERAQDEFKFLIVLGTVPLLLQYMGTSIYSMSEAFIGRSLIISRYRLAALKGIRFAVPTLRRTFRHRFQLFSTFPRKELQIVP